MNKFYSKDSIDRLAYQRNIVRITNPLFNQNTYTPWRLWGITMYVTPITVYPIHLYESIPIFVLTNAFHR